MKKFQEWLTKISDAMLNCKPLMILQGAFQMILPFTIVGAIGSYCRRYWFSLKRASH